MPVEIDPEKLKQEMLDNNNEDSLAWMMIWMRPYIIPNEKEYTPPPELPHW